MARLPNRCLNNSLQPWGAQKANALPELKLLTFSKTFNVKIEFLATANFWHEFLRNHAKMDLASINLKARLIGAIMGRSIRSPGGVVGRSQWKFLREVVYSFGKSFHGPFWKDPSTEASSGKQWLYGHRPFEP